MRRANSLSRQPDWKKRAEQDNKDRVLVKKPRKIRDSITQIAVKL